jgi:HsdM-like protein
VQKPYREGSLYLILPPPCIAYGKWALSGHCLTCQKLEIMAQQLNGIPADLESKLWAAADKLRGHLDAAEYKNVVLG